MFCTSQLLISFLNYTKNAAVTKKLANEFIPVNLKGEFEKGAV